MPIINHYLNAMRGYVDFTGRASRAEFWSYFLVVFLLSAVTMLLNPMLNMLASLVHFVPGLSVSCRRLHDSNRSGWLQLLYFVPVIGFIILMFLFVLDGTSGDNRFGANPAGKTDLTDADKKRTKCLIALVAVISAVVLLGTVLPVFIAGSTSVQQTEQISVEGQAISPPQPQ